MSPWGLPWVGRGKGATWSRREMLSGWGAGGPGLEQPWAPGATLRNQAD